MSIRAKYGFGPVTVEVDWLHKCPNCNNRTIRVTGWTTTPEALWAGDKAVCSKCGRKGEIDADGDNAWVEWDEIKAGQMSNIDKRARHVQRYANFGVDMMEWADGGYVKHSDYLALLDELEAKDKQIAELESRTVTLPENITSANAPEVFVISAEAERLGLRGAYASYAVCWNACRAAMLQGAEPVTTTNKLPFDQWLSQQTGTIDVECGCVMTEVFFHWLRVAYEAGNPPVIQDGLCPCCGRKPLKNKTCSVAGCDGKHVARGFCAMHYAIERKKRPVPSREHPRSR